MERWHQGGPVSSLGIHDMRRVLNHHEGGIACRTHPGLFRPPCVSPWCIIHQDVDRAVRDLLYRDWLDTGRER
jgi:hypothetical protein